MRLDEAQPGMPVTWRHHMARGYGYIEHVPAVVVRVGAVKVTIDAELAKGGSKRIAVDPAHLTERSASATTITVPREET